MRTFGHILNSQAGMVHVFDIIFVNSGICVGCYTSYTRRKFFIIPRIATLSVFSI